MLVRTVGFFCDHTSGTGGGEHHAFSIARALGRRWPVDLLVRAERFLPDAASFHRTFGIDVGAANVRPRVLESPRDVRRYDLFVNLSHFKVLPPRARHNILVIFFPQLLSEWVRDYDALLTISRYSTEWTTRYWGVTHVAHAYPPVETHLFAPAPKERLILSVGRFFDLPEGNNKNQLLMIRAFKALRARGVNGWRLVLAGASAEGHADHLARVRAEAAGEPIEIVIDPPFETVRDLYARAAVYWHAAGFEGDGLTLVPSAAEHFGLTVVEAMASGCLPVVADIGGPAEIVTEPEDGLRCQTVGQFVEKSLWAVTHDAERAALAERAQARSRDFMRDRFEARFDQVVDVVLDGDPERKARFFLGEGNHAEAERWFTDAVDRRPRRATPYVGLAECCYRTGRRELALAMWRKALAVEPAGPEATALRARVKRLDRQRDTLERGSSGALFGQSYFEAGKDAGLNDYGEYDASWSAPQAEIIATTFAPGTCLDVGCAKGDFVREMRARGVAAFGTDISVYSVGAAVPPVRDLLCAASIAALPFPDQAFDLVVAVEVLEHVPPELVDAALDELWRVSRRFVYVTVQNTTAADPDHFFADLTHVTMKPLAWWREQFRRHRFEVIPVELPFGEFRLHQIVAQPVGKFAGLTDAQVDEAVATNLSDARRLGAAGAFEDAVRAFDGLVNLLDVLELEGRRRPDARLACYQGMREAYGALGLADRAAAAAAQAASLAERAGEL